MLARLLAVVMLGTLAGCAPDEGTEVTCTEGGKRYKPGDSWLCSDNCNQCNCYSDGLITMTGKACFDGGRPDTAARD